MVLVTHLFIFGIIEYIFNAKLPKEGPLYKKPSWRRNCSRGRSGHQMKPDSEADDKLLSLEKFKHNGYLGTHIEGVLSSCLYLAKSKRVTAVTSVIRKYGIDFIKFVMNVFQTTLLMEIVNRKTCIAEFIIWCFFHVLEPPNWGGVKLECTIFWPHLGGIKLEGPFWCR